MKEIQQKVVGYMRHALITAGTKGIGRQVTEKLLREGYSVTANFRSDERAAEQLLTTFADDKERLQLVRGDVTKPDDCRHLVTEAVAVFGRIDLLINNAGPYIFTEKKLVDYTDSEWNEMIDGNLNGLFHLVRAAVPHMREQGFGRIITYGFQHATSAPGWMYRSAFAAAKVGAASLTKSIAFEEAEHGITANMVCPGDIIGDMKENKITDARQQKSDGTPIGRSGTGEDIARTIAFLCHDDSDMVTGSVIEVTGGLDVLGGMGVD